MKTFMESDDFLETFSQFYYNYYIANADGTDTFLCGKSLILSLI